jgi:ribonuclease P protein component
VVPKRFARRSVTRSLVKRQMRQALRDHAGRLPPGAWVLRLRAPVLGADETSAVTEGLRQRVRAELGELLDQAERQAGRAPAGPGAGPRRAPGSRRAKGTATPSGSTPA